MYVEHSALRARVYAKQEASPAQLTSKGCIHPQARCRHVLLQEGADPLVHNGEQQGHHAVNTRWEALAAAGGLGTRKERKGKGHSEGIAQGGEGGKQGRGVCMGAGGRRCTRENFDA